MLETKGQTFSKQDFIARKGKVVWHLVYHGFNCKIPNFRKRHNLPKKERKEWKFVGIRKAFDI